MFEKRLAVEVDGGQHGEEAIARRDEERSPVKGEGEWRHERIAHAIPPLGASGFDIRRK